MHYLHTEASVRLFETRDLFFCFRLLKPLWFTAKQDVPAFSPLSNIRACTLNI